MYMHMNRPNPLVFLHSSGFVKQARDYRNYNVRLKPADWQVMLIGQSPTEK